MKAPATLGKVLAMHEAGNMEIDVMDAGELGVLSLSQKGALDKINYKAWKLANPEDFDPAIRRDDMIADIYFSSVLGYNSQTFPTGKQPKSWAEFWDTGKFAGPRMLADIASGAVDLEFALLADGVAKDKLYPIDVARAFKSLDRVRPSIKKFWDTGAFSAQMLADKEVVLGSIWNGRLQAVADKGAPLAIEWNEAMLQTQYWAPLKGSKNGENAQRFIEFACQPELQANLAKLIPYGPIEPPGVQEHPRRPRRAAAVEPGEPAEGVPPERQVVGRQSPRGQRAVVAVAPPEGVGGGAEVRLHELTKTYGSVVAVRDVSVTVAPGSFFTLLGPSGSGKTTTLMMVAGFAYPTRGEVFVDGRPMAALPPQRRELGMVFQSYAVFPHLTVAENVAFPLEIRKTSRAETRRRVGEALELVRLTGYERRLPRQLSGGEQQRVALARALVFRPRVLLMDEPLGALDKKLRAHMQLELKHIQQHLHVTVLYVTHDQEEALTMSDRVAVMQGGRIEQCAASDDDGCRRRTDAAVTVPMTAAGAARTTAATARLATATPPAAIATFSAGVEFDQCVCARDRTDSSAREETGARTRVVATSKVQETAERHACRGSRLGPFPSMQDVREKRRGNPVCQCDRRSGSRGRRPGGSVAVRGFRLEARSNLLRERCETPGRQLPQRLRRAPSGP